MLFQGDLRFSVYRGFTPNRAIFSEDIDFRWLIPELRKNRVRLFACHRCSLQYVRGPPHSNNGAMASVLSVFPMYYWSGIFVYFDVFIFKPKFTR
tara:strand:+ start:886 stop:1170 length:285 start_codon:yes stop_codon:yes gene_type:complete